MMRFTKRGRVCIKAFLTLCYATDAVSLFCLWINQQISIDLYFTYVGQIRIPFEDGERESLNESEPACQTTPVPTEILFFLMRHLLKEAGILLVNTRNLPDFDERH